VNKITGKKNMKSNIANHLTLIGLFLTVILILGPVLMSAQTNEPIKDTPKTNLITGDEKKEIEAIVRDYLINNPSIIREALVALQIKEEKDRLERVAKNMNSFRADIYADPDSPVAGNPKGDVTVVVFFDYNCGYCKSTMPALDDLIAGDPSLRIIYKEFPILSAGSQLAAQAALAAKRQGKYEEFHREMMRSKDTGIPVIKSISEKLGLNYERLRKDMADPVIMNSIERNFRLANALSIEGTPAYIVGGQIIPGAVAMDYLANVVSVERAKLADKIELTNKPNIGEGKP
jgi:protein-disulfide isomerase